MYFYHFKKGHWNDPSQNPISHGSGQSVTPEATPCYHTPPATMKYLLCTHTMHFSHVSGKKHELSCCRYVKSDMAWKTLAQTSLRASLLCGFIQM